MSEETSSPRTPTPPPLPPPRTPTPPPIPPPLPVPRKMATTQIKVPTLDIKLSGAESYPEWATCVEMYLSLVSVGDTNHTLWDIVNGTYTKPPSPANKGSSDQAQEDLKVLQAWKNGNNVFLLTIRKNCEDEVKARIGNLTEAKAAYDELKKAFEGRTTTEFYALLDSFASLTYDDRSQTIAEHIIVFERA